MTMDDSSLPPGFDDMLKSGLIEALLGRRARRFFVGAEIPDGVLAYRSHREPIPLSELEKLLVVTACGGNTGWHHMIHRAKIYALHLSNYAGAGGGRTFPSAAGFHTSKTFFTDDDGVYILDNRDAPACADRAGDGALPLGLCDGSGKSADSQAPERTHWCAAGAPVRRAPPYVGRQPARHTPCYSGRRPCTTHAAFDFIWKAARVRVTG
jgi:hypothetical protein